MTALAAQYNAQYAFEYHKDNEQVQALLNLLGNRRESVVAWQITPHPDHSDYATFIVRFQDESQSRGYIALDQQRNKWYAGGNFIPAYQARRLEH